ncbi:hypothetical protein [Streptomyces sp. NPDC127092]|uniref:hypothetical protein n=1 Tax=Streptomyces sp. NPDC127092 TaxID=3347135 RepID=UPI003662EB7B
MLTGGRVYVGRAPNAGGTITWQDLTNATATMTDPANANFPGGACGVSYDNQGNTALVKIVTVNGQVWQTVGDTNGTNFIWNQPWVQQTTPTPAVLRNNKFMRALPPGAPRNPIPHGVMRP